MRFTSLILPSGGISPYYKISPSLERRKWILVRKSFFQDVPQALKTVTLLQIFSKKYAYGKGTGLFGGIKSVNSRNGSLFETQVQENEGDGFWSASEGSGWTRRFG